jgi:hypothetical protein
LDFGLVKSTKSVSCVDGEMLSTPLTGSVQCICWLTELNLEQKPNDSTTGIDWFDHLNWLNKKYDYYYSMTKTMLEVNTHIFSIRGVGFEISARQHNI